MSKRLMQTVSRMGVAVVMGAALAYSASVPAAFPEVKPRHTLPGNLGQQSGKRINIKQLRIVNGRLVLIGHDNKQWRLPNGVYRTTDGKQVAVRDGRIPYIVLPKGAVGGGQKGGSNASGAGPGKATGTPKRARYRVTINGFTVHNQTWDHALEVDGKGDEVFLLADVKTVNRDRKIEFSSQRRSKTMGDRNGYAYRVKAGSRSPMGGIQTGDEIPNKNPWRRHGRPRADRPPMVVWEGELVEGKTAVAIIPTIWEWDGGSDAFSEWTGWARDTARTLKDADVIDKLFGEKTGGKVRVVFEASELALGIALSLQRGPDGGILGKAQDRPIGMVRKGNRYVFSPKVLALNYHTAAEVLKTNFGLGRGVIEINYKDDPKLRGDYSLYLQVQRIQ